LEPETGPPPGTNDEPAITELLVAWRGGDQAALDQLFPLVYDQLRRISRRQLGAEQAGHTLSTTALVHEAYLKLVDQRRVEWVGRAQFYAVAARAMRRILVDYARRHRALRRGGPGPRPLSLAELESSGELKHERSEPPSLHQSANGDSSTVHGCSGDWRRQP